MIPDTIKRVSCEASDSEGPDADDCIANFVRDFVLPEIPSVAQIITLDGFDGVGKTTLARHLGQQLPASVIGFDDFLEKDQGHFLQALQIKKLDEAISVDLDKGRVVIEGCLMEHVLGISGRRSDFRLYIMRTTQHCSSNAIEWVSEWDVLCGEQSAQDLISEREGVMKRLSLIPEEFGGGENEGVPSLEKELIHYHRDFRPQEKADLIVGIVRRT